jgi:hypothetical protein
VAPRAAPGLDVLDYLPIGARFVRVGIGKHGRVEVMRTGECADVVSHCQSIMRPVDANSAYIFAP